MRVLITAAAAAALLSLTAGPPAFAQSSKPLRGAQAKPAASDKSTRKTAPDKPAPEKAAAKGPVAKGPIKTDAGEPVTVKSGDSLVEIAQRTGVSRQTLAELNKLKPPYNLKAGQQLKLPERRYYAVQPGDTLLAVGRRVGADAKALAEHNDLASTARIRAGQKLYLPLGAEDTVKPETKVAKAEPKAARTAAKTAEKKPAAAEKKLAAATAPEKKPPAPAPRAAAPERRQAALTAARPGSESRPASPALTAASANPPPASLAPSPAPAQATTAPDVDGLDPVTGLQPGASPGDAAVSPLPGATLAPAPAAPAPSAPALAQNAPVEAAPVPPFATGAPLSAPAGTDSLPVSLPPGAIALPPATPALAAAPGAAGASPNGSAAPTPAPTPSPAPSAPAATTLALNQATPPAFGQPASATPIAPSQSSSLVPAPSEPSAAPRPSATVPPGATALPQAARPLASAPGQTAPAPRQPAPAPTATARPVVTAEAAPPSQPRNTAIPAPASNANLVRRSTMAQAAPVTPTTPPQLTRQATAQPFRGSPPPAAQTRPAFEMTPQQAQPVQRQAVLTAPPPSGARISPRGYTEVGPTTSTPAPRASGGRPSALPPQIAAVAPANRSGPLIASARPPAVTDLASLGRGRFIWPTRGQILSPFGARGVGQKNDGLNIAIREGDPVRAAAAGQVVYAGDQVPSFGNLVLVKHDGGWVTAYGHMGRITVKNNDRIAQGQQLGMGGQTGAVVQPQLHFEVRYAATPLEKATPLDPMLVLPPQ